jgi:hypothetical protein
LKRHQEVQDPLYESRKSVRQKSGADEKVSGVGFVAGAQEKRTAPVQQSQSEKTEEINFLI